MAAASICMKMGHHHPPQKAPRWRQESRGRLWPKSLWCYNSRPLDVAPPSESELSRVKHLDVPLTRDLTWSSNSSCHVWKLLRHLDVIRGLRRRKGRESAPPERKALPRMLKAAEEIAPPPPPHHRHTRAGRCRKRGASGLMAHPPCTQAVSLPPLRPEVEKHHSEPASIHRQLDCWPLMVPVNTNTHSCTSTFVRTYVASTNAHSS